MRRTEALQGVRLIKFRSVWDRYESSELNQIEPAELLGITERTSRRGCVRFEAAGETGLLDRRLDGVSGKRLAVDRKHEVEALYRTHYSGFTAKHFHEHLVRDHQFTRGYTWTRLFLQSTGLLVRTNTPADPARTAAVPLPITAKSTTGRPHRIRFGARMTNHSCVQATSSNRSRAKGGFRKYFTRAARGA